MCGIGIIRAQQKLVQQAQKTKGFVHLIGGSDQIISNVVPTVMYVVSAGLLADGMYKMYLGKGKKEGF